MNDAILHAVEQGYKGNYPSGFGDEHTTPLILQDANGKPLGRFQENDSVIFFNFRQDRAREITEALIAEDREGKPFSYFPVQKLNLDYVSMTEYHKNFDFPVAFPKIKLSRILSEVLSEEGISQLRIAETEKYAHVTFFMNGGEEKKYPGEEWTLIDSPKVATYDLQPEMSAPEVTATVLEKIASQKYGTIILNYANPDMVGHTGVEPAILSAVEQVDQGIAQIIEEMSKQDGIVLITADHGNCEEMYAMDDDGNIIYKEDGTPKPSTEHSDDQPVPFILYGPDEVVKGLEVREEGVLADVAPTLLELINVKQPKEMTGQTMLKNFKFDGKRRPIMLIILDGWGISEREEGNAPVLGNTTTMKRLAKEYPSSQLIPYGKAVGLPEGTMGNSEVGHMNIGAGRVVFTDYERINVAIEEGSFYTNPVLLEAVRHAKKKGKALHLQGLASDIGVHSDLNHLIELLELARREELDKVYIHLFLDGRDSAPDSGVGFLRQIQKAIQEKGVGEIVTAVGRYYAMDRDQRWDRVQVAYDALVSGKGQLV